MTPLGSRHCISSQKQAALTAGGAGLGELTDGQGPSASQTFSAYQPNGSPCHHVSPASRIGPAWVK
jgi:hypothetical protein